MVAMNTSTCPNSTCTPQCTPWNSSFVIFLLVVGPLALLAGRDSRIDDVERRRDLSGLAPPHAGVGSAAGMAVERIGVVGLGAMGAGIAQVAIEAGFEVVGREVTAELGEAAAGRIGHFLTRKVEKGQRTQDERDAAARLGSRRPPSSPTSPDATS